MVKGGETEEVVPMLDGCFARAETGRLPRGELRRPREVAARSAYARTGR